MRQALSSCPPKQDRACGSYKTVVSGTMNQTSFAPTSRPQASSQSHGIPLHLSESKSVASPTSLCSSVACLTATRSVSLELSISNNKFELVICLCPTLATFPGRTPINNDIVFEEDKKHQFPTAIDCSILFSLGTRQATHRFPETNIMGAYES